MNNFVEDLANQISTFCTCDDGFKLFCCRVVEKIEAKVLACFYENNH
jgi:hypothetical protein